MPIISLDATRCVRLLAKESSCDKCEVVCPTQAIVIGLNPLPSINYSLCVGCGACDGVCPTQALPLESFSVTEFFFEFLEDSDNIISCRKNVPCIAALSVEHLLSLTSLKGGIVLDTGYCVECNIAHKCYEQIQKNVEEVSYLLEAMLSDIQISMKNICYKKVEQDPNRRDFFRLVTFENVIKGKKAFEAELKKADDELTEHTLQNSDIALLKKKKIPDKRKLLFSALKRLQKPSVYHVIDADELSFTSQKILDEESCDACQMCYRICPSGALSSDIKNSKIDFDPLLCIKCNICHDVCVPDAIKLSAAYDIKEFFEPEVQNLINFKVRRCDECNMIFSTNSEDKLCYRCKAEEQEAKALWGIK